MRYHVLGLGAIGQLVAHHLRLTTPAPISVIYRKGRTFQHLRTPDSEGNSPQIGYSVTRGERTSYSTDFDVEKIHGGEAVFSDPRLANREYNHAEPPNGMISSLIVCLKTQDTLSALRALAPRLQPNSVITLIQNGMGVYDQLCSGLFTNPGTRPHFILGTTTHGVTHLPQEQRIIHQTALGEGEMKFGLVSDPRGSNVEEWLFPNAGRTQMLTPPRTPALPLPLPPGPGLDNVHTTLSALLSMSELSPSLLPMQHLHHQLLLKLAINSAINPLTAALGLGSLRNGALLATDPGHRLVESICKETSAILTAYMHFLSNPAPPPPDVMRIFSRSSLERKCKSVIRSTGENISSMANDIATGRLTEVEQISGYLTSLASRVGVPAPIHRMLAEQVKFISSLTYTQSKAPVQHRLALQRRQSSLKNTAGRTYEDRQLELDAERNMLRAKSIELREVELRERINARRQLRHRRKRRWISSVRLVRHRMELAYKARQLEVGQRPPEGVRPLDAEVAEQLTRETAEWQQKKLEAAQVATHTDLPPSSDPSKSGEP